MKYIDADLLRKEIERRRLSNRYIDTDGYEEELLKIIDSLQQEQQEVDLDREIEEYWVATGWSKVMTLGKFKIIARYFYELGEQAKQDAPKGLDEAINQYLEGWDVATNIEKGVARAAFIAGAEWQKEKDEKGRSHLILRDVKDSWEELIKSKPDIVNHPVLCYFRGAEWHNEQLMYALKNDGKLPIELISKLHEVNRIAYKNGQENMKEQMLKDAEECELVCIKGRLAAILPMKEFQWTVGDKARIVVLKEEEEGE